MPLESRVEYLKLHTGKSFSIPFDELVVFSTNLAPRDLMDPAFLRRIPYKLEIGGPTPDEYRKIFKLVAKAFEMEASDEIIDAVIRHLTVDNDFPLASYQPKFLIDQVRAACKFEGIPPQFRLDLVKMALGNLFTKDSPGYRGGGHVLRGVRRGGLRGAITRLPSIFGVRCGNRRPTQSTCDRLIPSAAPSRAAG